MNKDQERTDRLVSNLVATLKNYFGLQKEYVMLEITEKITYLLTALILGAILFFVVLLAIIFLSFTIVALLKWLIGNEILSYGIVTVLYLLLGYVIYLKRRFLLIEPLMRFFSTILLKDNNIFASDLNPNSQETPVSTYKIEDRIPEVKSKIDHEQKVLKECIIGLVDDGRQSTQLFTFKKLTKIIGTTIYSFRLVKSIRKVADLIKHH